MNEEGKCCGGHMVWKWEQISDSMISKVYDDSLVKKVESLEFMKVLLKTPFISWLNDFGKSWFKEIFILIWYLSIIFWVIFLPIWIINIFNFWPIFLFFSFLKGVFMVILSVFLILGWFWIVKMKKWYPFLFVMQSWFYIAYLIIMWIDTTINLINGPILFMLVLFNLAIIFISFALISKNKSAFDWDFVKKEKSRKKKVKKDEIIEEVDDYESEENESQIVEKGEEKEENEDEEKDEEIVEKDEWYDKENENKQGKDLSDTEDEIVKEEDESKKKRKNIKKIKGNLKNLKVRKKKRNNY